MREAREVEVATLAHLHLHDAWHEVHYDSVTQKVPSGYTFGFNVHKQPQTARLSRLDKIHITSRLKESLEAIKTAFLAGPEHKAVITDLAPHVFVQRPPRWKCPLGLLGSAISVNTIKQQLDNIEAPDPITEWAQAERIIQQTTTKHHKENTVKPPTSTLALLLASTRNQVCRQGWLYLQSQGLAPAMQTQAFSMLVQCYENEAQDRFGFQ